MYDSVNVPVVRRSPSLSHFGFLRLTFMSPNLTSSLGEWDREPGVYNGLLR